MAKGVSVKQSDPYLVVRRSRVQGRGAFAIRKIRRGTRVIEYTGERISHAEADRRADEEERSGRHHTFHFIVDSRVVVDASVNGNEARFINHSCDPNCETFVSRGRVYIGALRTIYPGEELSYDYMYDRDGASDEEARRKYPCHCGSEICRGTIMVAAKKLRGKRASAETASATNP